MKKSKKGILVTFKTNEDGKSYITFDDMAQNEVDGTWEHHSFYTHREMSMQELRECEFSEEDFVDCGLAVLARLRAYVKLGEI